MSISLWEFASTCYRRPGVAEACLAIQDSANADVNMLLAAAWLAGDGFCWQPDDVMAMVLACDKWRTLCLLPLRQIRRNLKELAADDDWYQRIKALELEAEHHQIQWIEAAALYLATATSPIDTAAAVEHNLHIYFATLPATKAEPLRPEAARLIQLLIATATDPAEQLK